MRADSENGMCRICDLRQELICRTQRHFGLDVGQSTRIMSEICFALNKQVFILWKKIMIFVRSDGENCINLELLTYNKNYCVEFNQILA